MVQYSRRKIRVETTGASYEISLGCECYHVITFHLFPVLVPSPTISFGQAPATPDMIRALRQAVFSWLGLSDDSKPSGVCTAQSSPPSSRASATVCTGQSRAPGTDDALHTLDKLGANARECGRGAIGTGGNVEKDTSALSARRMISSCMSGSSTESAVSGNNKNDGVHAAKEREQTREGASGCVL